MINSSLKKYDSLIELMYLNLRYLRLRLLVLPVGEKLGDFVCEAVSSEPLHYIPTRSANLKVKGTQIPLPLIIYFGYITIHTLGSK